MGFGLEKTAVNNSKVVGLMLQSISRRKYRHKKAL
jgi:hypothetical protein|tara:strand:- start:1076 stop:1180 length:105 start_codon:yes stop_codon:yes gene_type:complete